MQFDFTHWNILVSWVIIIAELVVGTIPDPPWMRILAMPVSSIFLVFALEMLVFEIMYVYKLPAPFRISSVPRGDPMRPALYAFLEDIIAVDGKGGTRFRDRLDQRYKSSPPFRGMLHRVTMLWVVPQVIVAGGTLAGISIADRELAYTVCASDLQSIAGQKTEIMRQLVTDWLVGTCYLGGDLGCADGDLGSGGVEAREALLEGVADDPGATRADRMPQFGHCRYHRRRSHSMSHI